MEDLNQIKDLIKKKHEECEGFGKTTRAQGKKAILEAWEAGDLLHKAQGDSAARGAFTAWLQTTGAPLTILQSYLDLRRTIENKDDCEKLIEEGNESLAEIYRLVGILTPGKDSRKNKKSRESTDDDPILAEEVIYEIHKFLVDFAAKTPPSKWTDEEKESFFSLLDFAVEIKRQIASLGHRTIAEEFEIHSNLPTKY